VTTRGPAALVVATALAFAFAAPGVAREPVTLGIVFHVAEVDGRPVADDAFLDARLERANQLYAPYGVAFAKKKVVPLGAAHAVLETRADRDALGAFVKRGAHEAAIDCFVVRSFRDVDDPRELRRGVHWRTRAGASFVILSATFGGPTVLAHELGHYLGNPRHSDAPGNLMNPHDPGETPVLDAAQLRNLERALRR
jgi:hypothetical protein